MSRTWLLACVLAPGVLIAQERITLRIAPAPNQVIRLEMTQSMGFDITAEALPGGSMRVDGAIKVRGAQRVGAPDAQGRMISELTFDEMSVEMLLNGSPMPGLAPSALAGKSFTIVYDADGKVSDVKVPSEMEAAGAGVREMMKSLMGNLPSGTLAVGDSLITPSNLALPIPGLIPGGSSSLEGSNTFKLVRVTREGGDRIATLDMTIVAGMGGGMDLKMTGTGRLEWNVDRGFVKTGETDTRMMMTMPVPGGSGTMKMSGTVHMVMSGAVQP